jgi:hypothetical protein
MRTRIVIGAGAWLLGAAAATAGSLLVVSELGEGISAPPSQQTPVGAAEQAQASEPAAGPSATPTPRPHRRMGEKSGTSTGGTGGAASIGGTVLTSPGGTVVAQCASAGVYLVSWIPQQGFQASSVFRGPAAATRVVFTTTARTVTMAVSCSAGVPAATTVTRAVTPTATPSDDNGGGGTPGPGGGGGGGDT